MVNSGWGPRRCVLCWQLLADVLAGPWHPRCSSVAALRVKERP